jgi:DNA polymerase (family 10)
MGKGRFFTNQEIADLLRKMAAAYTVKDEDRFRIKAYEEAAVSVEHSTSDLKDLWDEGKLEDVPAIGKSLAGYLDELFRTGRVKHFEKVLSSLPPAMFVFDKIPGLGPKRSLALSKELGITSKKDAPERLKAAAKQEKIRKLPGFDTKSEENILKGIESLAKGEQKTKRMPLYQADAVASELTAYLKKSPAVIEAHPLGSLRRMLSTVGDIDISVSTKSPKEVMAHFFRYPKIQRVVSKGEEALGRVVLQSGQQVDIRLSSPESYGAMLQYFTGSKQHNIYLREYALGKHLSLSEYGIKNLKTQKVAKTRTEEEFYRALGLKYIPPEIREGSGEIEAALRQAQGKPGGLPDLIEEQDIKGDLHLHSDFPIEPSHDVGTSSMEEMIKMALDLGYDYVGFTEHNPSVSRHSKKEIIDLVKKKKEAVDKIIYSGEKRVKIGGRNLPITVFNALEVDIRPNGELALPEPAFELLDFVIVAIHGSFEMSREKMTKRVLKGLSHPKAKILAHPTGRKIGSREGYEFDWEAVFDFCRKNGKALEISAWPDRLDLPDTLVREAVKAGVKLVIDSDSHAADQMTFMRFGVAVARRGWAETKDVLNTLPKEKLSDILLRS